MSWNATVTDTKLDTSQNISKLIVTLTIANETGIKFNQTFTMVDSEGREVLRNKILDVTNAIDSLSILQSDLQAMPQVDVSPVLITNVQNELNKEFGILKTIQSLVKEGRIPSDSDIIVKQLERFKVIIDEILVGTTQSILIQ